MPSRAGDPTPVQSVTAAPSSHSADLDRRIRRYVVSMVIRTVCVILVVAIPHPVRWVFAAGAVFLPYFAVVMANAGRRRRAPSAPVPVERLALTGTPVPVPRAGDED